MLRFKCLALTFALLTAAASAQLAVPQLGQLTAPSLGDDSYLGTVAVGHNTIAVGAPGSGYASGDMYVYQQPSTGWSTVGPAAILQSSGCDQGLPIFISADGGTVAGSLGACYGGLGLSGSSIAIYVRPSSGWQNANTPTAIIGSPVGFGFCGGDFTMSSDGNTILCTDSVWSGKQYLFIFDKPAAGWTTGMHPTSTILMPQGIGAVAINRKTIAIATYKNGLQIYQRTATGIKQLATLSTSDGSGLGFGRTGVVMDGQTVVVTGYDSTTNTSKGVYVFSKSASGWTNATETAQLTAPNLASTAAFGWTIAKSGSAVLVGGQYTSAAYLYLEPASGWLTTAQPNATIVSTDPYQSNFGYSVAILGKTIAVGDPTESAINLNGGAAYVFQMQ